MKSRRFPRGKRSPPVDSWGLPPGNPLYETPLATNHTDWTLHPPPLNNVTGWWGAPPPGGHFVTFMGPRTPSGGGTPPPALHFWAASAPPQRPRPRPHPRIDKCMLRPARRPPPEHAFIDPGVGSWRVSLGETAGPTGNVTRGFEDPYCTCN